MYLRKRGKKWYYTIEVPTEDGQGRLREERVGGTSYAQAAKAYRQAMKALDEAAVSEKPVIKMMDFLLEWLEKDVRINLGPIRTIPMRESLNGILVPVSGMKLWMR